MSAPKNYTTKILTKEDEPAIAAVLAKHPLWKLKHARAQVAANKFAARIRGAGKQEVK